MAIKIGYKAIKAIRPGCPEDGEHETWTCELWVLNSDDSFRFRIGVLDYTWSGLGLIEDDIAALGTQGDLTSIYTEVQDNSPIHVEPSKGGFRHVTVGQAALWAA